MGRSARRRGSKATALPFLPGGACPPLIDHTSHLRGGSHTDLTPTHYGIGSETPNLKPTGFKSKHLGWKVGQAKNVFGREGGLQTETSQEGYFPGPPTLPQSPM